MAFSTLRGRPPRPRLDDNDAGTPELQFKRALGVTREPHERIDLPCEKNKFDAGHAFALDFIDMASQRFSPQIDALKQLHVSAAEARAAAVSGATVS